MTVPMSVLTGTWVTLVDWTPEGLRVRRGPDGTLAVWHRSPGGYALTHHTPDGRVTGPVRARQANEARKAMRALRRAE